MDKIGFDSRRQLGDDVSMIRRDYFLRMIEEFVQALARIRALKNEWRLGAAFESLDAEFKQLVGDRVQGLAQLSETELFARLIQAGPTRVVREKAFMLTTLFKEAGDIAMTAGQVEEGHLYYLKALNLLLNNPAHEEVFECPEFVPKIEMLKTALEGAPLPIQTQALLMQHYERLGEFAKAEDALFAMLETEPDNGQIVEFGVAFYRRLLEQSDDALSVGNLPRAEVEQAVNELQNRLNAFRPGNRS